MVVVVLLLLVVVVGVMLVVVVVVVVLTYFDVSRSEEVNVDMTTLVYDVLTVFCTEVGLARLAQIIAYPTVVRCKS